MKARVTSTVMKPTQRKPNPRPRKYASASDRQAAYRDRAPEICFRAEPKTVETLDRIAETIDRPRTELLLSMVKFALANHDWARFGLTHKPLPFGYGTQDETRKENPAMLHEFARIGKPFNYDGRTWKVTAYDHTGETIEAATTDRKSPYRRERINVSELMTTRRPLKKNPATKRKPTPAQLAARERFAEMARSGAFKGAGGRKANPVKYRNEAKSVKKDDPAWIGYSVHRPLSPSSAYVILKTKDEAIKYAQELADRKKTPFAVSRIRYNVAQG